MRFFDQDFSLTDHLVHPSVRAFPDRAAQYRSFVVWHVLGAVLLMGVTGALMVSIGWPTRLPLVFALWLLTPLMAPLILRATGNIYVSQMLSLISLSGIVTLIGLNASAVVTSVSLGILTLPLVATLYQERWLIILAGALGALGAALIGLSDLPFLLSDFTVYFVPILIGLCVVTLVAVLIDARLRRTEQAARQGEADLRFLTDQVTDMLMRHGPNGEPTYVSPACQNVLGCARQDLFGRSFMGLIHSEDQEGVEKAFERAGLFGGEASLEYRMQHSEGHYIWVETRLKPVITLTIAAVAKTPKGLPMPACFELVSVTRDITTRKIQELELVHDLEVAELANQSKSQFLANMSHELRTPLNAVIGFSEMIKEETFGPIGVPKYLEYAGLITSSGHHLLGLINDILDMSKIESGKYSLCLEQIDAAQVVGGSLSLVRVASDKAGVNIVSAIENDIPQFCADKRALKQILLNLLSNAVKFTPKGGAITVGASCDTDMFYLQVLDTGIGISEADLARLGQPYEQVIDQYTKNKAGTGLGLSLVSALAELHGGNVTIESIVGAGTCVTVSMPLRQTAGGQAQSERAVVNDNDRSSVSAQAHAPLSQPNSPVEREVMKGAA